LCYSGKDIVLGFTALSLGAKPLCFKEANRVKEGRATIFKVS